MSYRLVLLLALGFQSFNALAANDLDKWNSPEGRQVRTALKNKTTPTTTYKEMPNVVDAEYRSTSNGGKVLHRIEHATTQNGSKVGTTIEALKTVDKTAVAKKYAAQFAKEWGPDIIKKGAQGILITAAMNEMLDGLGWIMNEGGQLQRPIEYLPTDEAYAKVTSPYYYKAADSRITTIFYSPENACRHYLAFLISESGGRDTYDSTRNTMCYYKNSYGGTWYADLLRYTNPHYGSSTLPTHTPVSPAETQTKITDYLNNSPNTSKDLLIEEAYKPTGKGYIQWSDDPDSRVEIFGDTPNIAKNIYDSDNPVADGLTKSTPKITDSTTLDGETTPNPNPEPPTIPDPVTGQPIPNPNYNPNLDTGSTSSFQLPAFCNYASKLCDWLDWTQQDLEEENTEELQPPSDQGIFDRVFNFNFNFGGQCPPNYTFVMNTQYFGGTKTFDLSWLCMIFTFLGYPLIFLSHCLGFWIFYEVAARKEFKW